MAERNLSLAMRRGKSSLMSREFGYRVDSIVATLVVKRFPGKFYDD